MPIPSAPSPPGNSLTGPSHPLNTRHIAERVTPLVLTYNEAPNVGRTFERLRWARRVVVMDSGSTDGTLRRLAEYPNVEVVHRPFDTHRDQWNAGLDHIDTPFVLALDADYVLSAALIDELAALPDDPAASGYRARFVYCIRGRPLRGALYPPRIVLFRTGAGRYIQDGHTQALEIGGEVRDLGGVIYHDDRKPRARWLSNQTAYAAQEAEKLLATPREALGRIDRLRRAGVAPLLTPLYCLVAKRLLLDGRAGLAYTYERTYAELLLSLQLLDRRLTADHA